MIFILNTQMLPKEAVKNLLDYSSKYRLIKSFEKKLFEKIIDEEVLLINEVSKLYDLCENLIINCPIDKTYSCALKEQLMNYLYDFFKFKFYCKRVSEAIIQDNDPNKILLQDLSKLLKNLEDPTFENSKLDKKLFIKSIKAFEAIIKNPEIQKIPYEILFIDNELDFKYRFLMIITSVKKNIDNLNNENEFFEFFYNIFFVGFWVLANDLQKKIDKTIQEIELYNTCLNEMLKFLYGHEFYKQNNRENQAFKWFILNYKKLVLEFMSDYESISESLFEAYDDSIQVSELEGIPEKEGYSFKQFIPDRKYNDLIFDVSKYGKPIEDAVSKLLKIHPDINKINFANLSIHLLDQLQKFDNGSFCFWKGVECEHGILKKKDFKSAMKYYSLASEYNHAESINRICLLHNVHGLDFDKENLYDLLFIAGDHGLSSAYILIYLYKFKAKESHQSEFKLIYDEEFDLLKLGVKLSSISAQFLYGGYLLFHSNDQALSHEGLRLIKISLARQNPFSIIVCKHLSKYKNLFNELENEIINKYYNYLISRADQEEISTGIDEWENSLFVFKKDLLKFQDSFLENDFKHFDISRLNEKITTAKIIPFRSNIILKKELSKFVDPDLELLLSGETEKIEYKASARWDAGEKTSNAQLNILKGVAALSNTHGGSFIIGVYDEDQWEKRKTKIKGLEEDYQTLDKKNRDGFETFLVSIFNDKNIFSEDIFIDYLKWEFKQIEGKDIIIINVEPAENPVFVTWKKEEKRFFRRIKANSLPIADPYEQSKYIRKRFK